MLHSDVVQLLKSKQSPDPMILLSDGEYWIKQHGTPAERGERGFLFVLRSGVPGWPSGEAVIGSFSRSLDGTWSCEVSAPYDGVNDGSESKPLGSFPTQDDAVAALWLGRHDAYVDQVS